MGGNRCFRLSRLWLNGEEALSMAKIPAFSAGTWWRRQSNPRLNPANSRREFFNQTWPACCLLRQFFLQSAEKNEQQKIGTEENDNTQKSSKQTPTLVFVQAKRQTVPDTGGRSRTPIGCHHTRFHRGEGHLRSGLNVAGSDLRRDSTCEFFVEAVIV